MMNVLTMLLDHFFGTEVDYPNGVIRRIDYLADHLGVELKAGPITALLQYSTALRREYLQVCPP